MKKLCSSIQHHTTGQMGSCRSLVAETPSGQVVWCCVLFISFS
jgi:hypothetical protein